MSKRHALLLPIIAMTAPVLAQQAPSPEQLERLEQRIQVLEHQLEQQRQSSETQAKEAPTVVIGEKGFSAKRGPYELKLQNLIQVDGRFFAGDGPGKDGSQASRFADGFRVRRARIFVDGSIGSLVAFRIMPELAGDGSGSSTFLLDAYVDLRFDPAASLRIGKQKAPVDLERLLPAAAIPFIERGYPTEMAPNRDIGVALFGELYGNRLNYSIGLFNGTRDGRDIDGNDTDNRHDLEGRVIAEPFRTQPGLLQGLGFGISGTRGGQQSAAPGAATLPQYRTPGQNVFFQYAANAQPDGDRTRWFPQAYWYHERFGLLGEYASVHQDVKQSVTTGSGSSAVTTVTPARFHTIGYELTFSYVLTGEDATSRAPLKPSTPFHPGGDGWGAFELVTRHGQLRVDNAVFSRGFANSAISAREASSLGLGLNWYLTENIKMAFNYDETHFEGGDANGGNRPTERALLARVQLVD